MTVGGRSGDVFGVEVEYRVEIEDGISSAPSGVERSICESHQDGQAGTDGRRAMLFNGACVYLDEPGPEWATAECDDPFEVAAQEVVGDNDIKRRAQCAAADFGSNVQVYKHRARDAVSGHGTHLNIAIKPCITRSILNAYLSPAIVTSQIFFGAGSFSVAKSGQQLFEVSARAHGTNAISGDEKIPGHPLIKTRNEHLGNANRWKRLQIHGFDSVMNPHAMITRAALFRVIVDQLQDDPRVFEKALMRLPVAALREISSDVEMKGTVRLFDESQATALEVVDLYLSVCEKRIASNGARPGDAEALALLRVAVDDMQRDPALLSDRVDWILKRQLVDGYLQSCGYTPNVAAGTWIDLQYHLMDDEKGWFFKAQRDGLVADILDPALIDHCATEPPARTRAAARVALMREFKTVTSSGNWDRIEIGRIWLGATRRNAPFHNLYLVNVDDPDPSSAIPICPGISLKLEKSIAEVAAFHAESSIVSETPTSHKTLLRMGYSE